MMLLSVSIHRPISKPRLRCRTCLEGSVPAVPIRSGRCLTTPCYTMSLTASSYPEKLYPTHRRSEMWTSGPSSIGKVFEQDQPTGITPFRQHSSESSLTNDLVPQHTLCQPRFVCDINTAHYLSSQTQDTSGAQAPSRPWVTPNPKTATPNPALPALPQPQMPFAISVCTTRGCP